MSDEKVYEEIFELMKILFKKIGTDHTFKKTFKTYYYIITIKAYYNDVYFEIEERIPTKNQKHTHISFDVQFPKDRNEKELMFKSVLNIMYDRLTRLYNNSQNNRVMGPGWMEIHNRLVSFQKAFATKYTPYNSGDDYFKYLLDSVDVWTDDTLSHAYRTFWNQEYCFDDPNCHRHNIFVDDIGMITKELNLKYHMDNLKLRLESKLMNIV